MMGSNMLVCVLLVSNSRRCCLAAPGDHEGADNTRGSLTPTIHTQSCLIPIIIWCHHFSTATNILLIKSNLKFESEATTVSVAMSPRYLGGKYRNRLHPRSRKCACLFLRETGCGKSNCARPASSASRGDNEVDHAVCLKLNIRCTLPFPMKMASSTQLWFIRASAGRYVFRWDRLLDEG